MTNPTLAKVADRYFVAFLGVACLATYLATLLPGVGHSGDTGEFQFIGRVLGVPHPTGYPTYVSLNGLFVRIVPFGSLAYRSNLLSATLAVVCVILVYRICRQFVSYPPVAAVAALLFAWSPVFWIHAIVAEVYALNALFVALTLCLFLRWRRTRSARDLLIASACYAFSFGNHLTMITFFPAVAFLVLMTDPKVLRRGPIVAGIGGLIVLSASQYLLLMWRSADPETAFVWRGAGTWRSLWTLVSGAQFRSEMFASSFEQAMRTRLDLYMTLFWDQFRWATPLILLGAVRMWRHVEGWFFVAGYVCTLLFAFNYWIGDIEAYFVPSFLIATIWFAFGCDAVLMRLRRSRISWRVSTAAIWIFPLAQLATHWSEVDRSHDTDFADDTRSYLEEIRDEGLLVSDSWMRSTALWYFILGERCRSEFVHVLNAVDVKRVAHYVRGERPIWLSETRTELKANVSVYALGDRWLDELQAEGLYLFSVADGLHVIHAESRLSAALARKHGLPLGLKPINRAVQYLDGWKPPESWGRWAATPRPTFVLSSYDPPAELVIQLAPWKEMGQSRIIRVLLGNSEIAQFRLMGDEWQMQEFVVPLLRPLHNALLTLEILNANGEPVLESEPYSLPVGSMQVRAAPKRSHEGESP